MPEDPEVDKPPEPKAGENESLGRQRMEAVVANRAAVAAVSQDILGDPERRQEFLDDPTEFLRKAGVPLPGTVELTDRDRDLVKIIADPEIAKIYADGDLDQLRDYLRATYPSLVSDPSRVAWTVADFEVAIEAVAIAVGVAVAPILPVDRVSEVARLESVMNARLAAQEARLRALEERQQ